MRCTARADGLLTARPFVSAPPTSTPLTTDPPAANPLVCTPPAATLPAATAIAADPPAANPLVCTPLVCTPLVSTPLVSTPLVSTPLVSTPLVSAPPAAPLSASNPPAANPLVCTPLTATLPAAKPLAIDPPAATPLVCTPPAATLPAATPLVCTPPAADPLAATPLASALPVCAPLASAPLASAVLRRFLLLALLAAGWLLGLMLVTATAGHADTTPARPVAGGGSGSGNESGGSERGGTGERRSGPLDRAVTGLVKSSLHGLARTAEGVPGTLTTTVHHPLSKTVHTVTAALGDTPRVLGRPGPADAPHPTAPHAAHGRGTDGLPPPERGAAAGHPIIKAPTPLPATGAGPGSGLGTGAGSRTARHDAAPGSAAHRHAASLHDHPRTPAPYAPAAPVSLTAGPAASSSNAAGPAFLLRGPARHPMTALSPATGGPFRPVPHAPAREPRHTPD
ncbi:hypothetical protein J4573_39665 [Actinomadura barringtoniae]|uniref:Uncharacterized protein n=1 Tax=Actinomadura barringtoniae TaxID=1427535 RepID=A0A939PJF2_9ACTN|nr:hypothetical protein [Actinomadura barringtoniae]MBO2453268.1 hypothetical protein [Actinomadura barringtoniae]